ncbi:LysR family transcriptional regulator [Comamonadaceae bacterium G21597-S1]|nr:LysR family transcriptional regulator [Comamonadaceae bacterium G21597-S1]
MNSDIITIDMNLQQLETFNWIAKLRSFGLAARRLHTTQSTVSMRIAELEKEVGAPLLDRSRRSVKLTPKGRELMPYAEDVVRLLTDIRHFIVGAGTISGTIRIGVSELVGLTWLASLVEAIASRLPHVDVELQVGLSGSMLKRLRDGDLDLLLMPTDGMPIVGMRMEPLGAVRFSFVAGPHFPSPDRTHTPESLVAWPLICQPSSSLLHGMIEAWYENGGVKLDKIIDSGSMETSARLATANLGISYLPLAYYEPQFASKDLIPVRVRPLMPPVPFFAVLPRTRTSPLIEAVVQMAREYSTFSKRIGKGKVRLAPTPAR